MLLSRPCPSRLAVTFCLSFTLYLSSLSTMILLNLTKTEKKCEIPEPNTGPRGVTLVTSECAISTAGRAKMKVGVQSSNCTCISV